MIFIFADRWEARVRRFDNQVPADFKLLVFLSVTI